MMTDHSRLAAGMRRQSELRRRRLAEGAKLIGWKVGFGTTAAKQALGITAPLVGFLLDRALLACGATISLAGWHKPVAEPEIAIHLGRDVPPGADPATARAAISGLAPALELADVDGPTDDIEAILAGDIFQRHVVLGPPDPSRASGRLDGLAGRLTRSGKSLDVPADLEANTGALIAIVGHVADVAGQCGEGLCAGHFIIAGSVVPPLFVAAGESLTFELAPIGAVSVTFAP